jgi:phosphatidylglycerophosphate synthase
MPPQLSMSMRRDAAEPDAQAAAVPAPALTSHFEERIVRWLCQPVLPYIPRSVHPNTISLINHGMSWMTAILAVVSVHLPSPYRSLALAGAGLGMLLSMIGDCLDGMHARATDQCSKLGEMMDHWLDAIVVPLVVLGASLALEMEPWAIAAVNVTATMVYNSQLVLYHHTGKFVHPEPATGMEAQFGLSLGYVAYGALLYFVDRDQLWLDYAVLGIALLGLYVQMRCNGFYYVRLGKLMRHHLVFVGLLSAFGALYLLGALDLYAFALCLIFTSFRVCGTYVLFTIVKRPYGGGDLGVVAFLAAIAGAHFLLPPLALGALTLQTLLPYLACAYMLARNLIDFSRHYAVFQPATR